MAERQALSYSMQEFADQKNSDLFDIKMVRTMGKRARHLHTRGLESLMEDNSEERASQRKEQARNLIHLHGETLVEGSGVTQDAVTAFASKMSKLDCKEALSRAKKDEIDALKVYKEAKMTFQRAHSKRQRAKVYVVSLFRGI